MSEDRIGELEAEIKAVKDTARTYHSDMRQIQAAQKTHHEDMKKAMDKITSVLIKLTEVITTVANHDEEIKTLSEASLRHSNKLQKIDTNTKDIVDLEKDREDLYNKVNGLLVAQPVNTLTSNLVQKALIFIVMATAVFVGEMIHHNYEESLKQGVIHEQSGAVKKQDN